MNELESRTISPWGISTTGLEMAWVRTAEGLRMHWTRATDAVRPVVLEIDAARQTSAARAA